jgi:hypothetical protein
MKTYYVVLVIESYDNLLYSDLFINDLKSAQKRFITYIKEINKNISKADIEEFLDDGYCTYNGYTVMYIEPMNIFSKKK